MVRRVSIWLVCFVSSCWAAVPTPREHFGFTPGDDYKLAGYGEIVSYFQKLEKASGRIRLAEFGRTSLGRPMYIAFLSSEQNLRRLDRYREISRRLALGAATREEARRLAAEGKTIVWIDSGLHASEVAPAQHAPELAYRMVAGEDEEVRRVRANVILLQVPVINPDGLDMIAEWYRRNVGTPYELAPLPWLYQKYAGHDNNRDYYMLNLAETRHVTRLLFREWFPQIVYNQHQQPAFPARIFVPPYAEPLNPHIPAAVMEGINLIGSAMAERFAAEGKPGVLSYYGFDGWWNGGLRSVPAFHNMHGILTETALYSYATPRVYQPGELPERFAGGIPAKKPTIFYQRPWLGGKWGVRDAIEYMLTADFAILDLAAARRSDFLMKAYEMARAATGAGEKGSPFAYLVPPAQWDRSHAIEMLRRLGLGGVEIERAKAPFQAGGKAYPEGTYVLPAAQPFRAYLMDLLEPQHYPELRTGTSGPIRRPYDIAGWTLSMQMGVSVDRIDEPFDAIIEPVRDILAAGPALNYEGLGKVRVALYEPWTANLDTGWTEWFLDYHKIPYTPLHNSDFQKGGLSERFDAILFASQTAASILHGTRDGEPAGGRGRGGPSPWDPKPLQRPEYTGGIGLAGLGELDAFVRAGGTLIALDSATQLPIQYFPLPVRNVIPPRSDTSPGETPAAAFDAPGSLLRITVDSTHPLGAGMPREAIVFTDGGQAFEITLLEEYNKGEREVRSAARYAASNLLASGWLSGQREVAGKHVLIEAHHGKGRVVLFGFRPQFRGQTFGTFRLLLNAIRLGAAR